MGVCFLKKQDCIKVKDPCPPWCFLYLRETKGWWCGEGEGEEGEKVSLLTHATARGMGKKSSVLLFIAAI